MEATLIPYRATRAILSFDELAAEHYAGVLAARERAGTPIHAADAQIAAICLAHGATCATRNVKDFTDTGVDLTDPWTAETLRGVLSTAFRPPSLSAERTHLPRAGSPSVLALGMTIPANAASAVERHRAGPWPDYSSCQTGRKNLIALGSYIFNVSARYQYGPNAAGWYINYSRR